MYTSFSFSYMQRALLLANTLRRVHPNWRLWALVTDREPPGFDRACYKEYDEWVFSDQLGYGEFEHWMFKHDIVEACTAVKGRMMSYLLARGASKVIYFDPDIAIFSPLDELIDDLDRFSVVITPHQSEPNLDHATILDNELTSMRYGIYNLGFIAMKNDDVGRRVSDWWQDRLYEACYDQPEQGLFTDQKYFDLLPALFPQVLVNRAPGYNVASWNLSTRRLTFDSNGDLIVNDCTLKFFHFTKVNAIGEAMISRYAKENTEVYELLCWYKQAIARLETDCIPKGWWAFNTFENGQLIPKIVRIIYRNAYESYRGLPSPFTCGPGTFHDIMTNAGHLEPI